MLVYQKLTFHILYFTKNYNAYFSKFDMPLPKVETIGHPFTASTKICHFRISALNRQNRNLQISTLQLHNCPFKFKYNDFSLPSKHIFKNQNKKQPTKKNFFLSPTYGDVRVVR